MGKKRDDDEDPVPDDDDKPGPGEEEEDDDWDDDDGDDWGEDPDGGEVDSSGDEDGRAADEDEDEDTDEGGSEGDDDDKEGVGGEEEKDDGLVDDEGAKDDSKTAKGGLRKKKVPLLVFIGVLAVVVILVLVPWLSQIYAQGLIEDTTIDVLSIEVLDASGDTIGLSVELEIDSPSSVDAEYGSCVLDVSYGGGQLGTVAIAGKDLDIGTVTVTTALVISDTTVRDSFIEDMLELDTLDVEVSGDLTATASVLFSKVDVTVDVYKTVTIDGLGSIDIDITDIGMLSATGSSCVFEATVSLDNPAALSFDLDAAVFDINTSHGYLGEVSGQGFHIVPGSNSFDMTLDSADVDGDVLALVASDYLSGEPVVLDISGAFDTRVGGLVGLALAQFTAQVTLPGLPNGTDVGLELDELRLSYIAPDLVLDYSATVTNPTDIQGTISGLVLAVRDTGGARVGTVSMAPLEISPGSNAVEGTTTFLITDAARMEALAGVYLNGGSLALTLSGDASQGGISQLLSGITLPINLTNNDPLNIDVDSMDLLEVNDTRLKAGLTVTLTGPAGLKTSLDAMDLGLSVGGIPLGSASVGGMDIALPQDPEYVEADVTINNMTLLRAVMSDYLAGNDTLIEASFAGSGGVNVSDTLVSSVLEAISVDFILKGGSPLGFGVNYLDIVDCTSDSITVTTNVTIDSPMGIAGALSAFHMSLVSTYGVFGNVSIPALNISQGNNTLNLTSTLYPPADVMGAAVTAYLEGLDTHIELEPVNGTDSFISTVLDLLRPTVTLGAGDPVEVGDLDFTLTSLDTANGTLGLDVLASVDNPTTLAVTLEDLRADLSYDGGVFAFARIGDIDIQPGSNLISRSLTVEPTDMSTLREVARAYLTGSDSFIEVDLRTGFDAPCITKVVTRAVIFNVTLEALEEGVDMDLSNMTVTGTSDGALTLEVDAVLTNPTFVEGPMPPLYFNIERDGLVVGNFTTPVFTLLAGTNHQSLEVDVGFGDPADSQGIVDDLLDGSNVTLKLVAAGNGETLSYLLKGYSMDVTLHTDGTFDVGAEDVQLLSADSETGEVELSVNVTVNNPTEFTIDVDEVTVEASFKNATVTSVLGSMVIDDVQMVPGNNRYFVTGNLTPYNLVVTRAIIQNYLGGVDTTIKCSVTLGAAPAGGSAKDFKVTRNVVLGATEELNLTIDDVLLKGTGDDHIIVGVVISVYNPTIVRGDIPSLPFEIEYKGGVIGTLDTNEVYLATGWNEYEFDVNVTTMSGAQLDKFVSDYIAGKDVVVTVRARDTTTLGYLLSGLEMEVHLSSGVEIDIAIENIKLLEATSGTLSFQVNVNITNPTTLEVGLNDTQLDVMYNGTDVGDLIIDNRTIVPGANILKTVLNLTSSSQDDLEEIISGHIGGENITLTIEGVYNITAAGAGTPVQWDAQMDVVFEGARKNVIEKVTVDDIDINVVISASPSVDYTVWVTARVHNPTDIPFNLTHIKFDVYFDDPDGATVDLPFPIPDLNYPAASNIFVKTIDEDVIPVKEFSAGQSRDHQTQFTDNDLETGFRLKDEYDKGQLKLDIRNGLIDIEIGDFTVQVEFSQENVPVS